MNFCFLYAAIWIIELFLYSLGWADINKALSPGVLGLVITTIVISLIWGYKYRKIFEFRYIEMGDSYEFDSNALAIITIIGINILEFVYCRQIPFISILLGRTEYTTYTGLPLIHVLVVTYSCYYSFRSYYIYEATENKTYLVRTLIIATLHLLVFSRVSLMILLFEIVIVKISKAGGIRIILFSPKTVVLIVVLFISLYLFGILGNLRCGCKWNDCSIIDAIGSYNDKYPSFLPEQYKWAYTYITSPLANLNNGIIENGTSINLENYIVSYIPDFLNRRLFPDYLSLIPDPRTIPDLTAVAGYYYFYYFGGFVGATFMFIVLTGGSIWVLRKLHFLPDQFFAFLMVAVELIVFIFFYNVIYLSQCSLCLAYPLISYFFKRVKIKGGIKRIRVGGYTI